jgi:hypothetical protein
VEIGLTQTGANYQNVIEAACDQLCAELIVGAGRISKPTPYETAEVAILMA